MDESLTRGIAALREPVRVRPAWRDALMREIAAAPQPSAEPTERRAVRSAWTLHPATALAAAIAILVVGLSAGAYLSRMRDSAIGATPNAGPSLTTVRFVIVAPAARQVSLVGDFNGWSVNAHPMRASHDGQSWILEVPLSAGRHTYAFVVDGDVLRDPAAATVIDDDFGVRNSVIFVGDGRT